MLTAGFHVTGASFIRLSASTRPARSGNSGRTPPVVSLKKTGVLPNQLLWDLRQMRYE